MDIRLLRPEDIPHVQLANITNLPENYFCKYYLYHAMSWPQLSYVAVDVSVVPCSGELLCWDAGCPMCVCAREGKGRTC
jgi:ribosomal protein S18 acetylase RimI-like enzyme